MSQDTTSAPQVSPQVTPQVGELLAAIQCILVREALQSAWASRTVNPSARDLKPA